MKLSIDILYFNIMKFNFELILMQYSEFIQSQNIYDFLFIRKYIYKLLLCKVTNKL